MPSETIYAGKPITFLLSAFSTVDFPAPRLFALALGASPSTLRRHNCGVTRVVESITVPRRYGRFLGAPKKVTFAPRKVSLVHRLYVRRGSFR